MAAVLIRPANPKTAAWIVAQAEAVRKNAGRCVGAGPTIEAILNGIVESKMSFEDCHGMSDIASKMTRWLRGDYRSVASGKQEVQ